MATLLVNGVTASKNQGCADLQNVVFSESLDGSGVYTGTNWQMYGPSTSGVDTTGWDVDDETQSFTPDVPGRYLVRLTATNNNIAETFTCLVEVQDPQVPGHSIPAANETNEYDSNEGWARSSEAFLSLASKSAGYKKVVSVFMTAGGNASSKNSIVRLGENALTQWKEADLGVEDGYNNLTLVVNDLAAASAADATIKTETLVMLLEDIVPYDPLVSGTGKALAMVSGVINWTTTLMNVDDILYAHDSPGNITNDPANDSTHVRRVGIVLTQGHGTVPAVPNEFGTIYFNGEGILLGSVVGAAGVDTQVQFNDGGAFGGSTLEFDKTGGALQTGTYGVNVTPSGAALVEAQVNPNEVLAVAMFSQLDNVTPQVPGVVVNSMGGGPALLVGAAGGGTAVSIDQDDDGIALDVTSGVLSTSECVSIVNNGTGVGLIVGQVGDNVAFHVGGSPSPATATCVEIDNPADGTGLEITQTGDGVALMVANHGAGTAVILSQNSDAIALYVDNIDPVGVESCVKIYGVGTAASLHVVGAGTGPALEIVQSGGGTALDVQGSGIALNITGGVRNNVHVIVFGDSPYPVLDTDYTIACDVTAGPIEILLPPALTSLGRVLKIGDHLGLVNNVDTIDITASLGDTVNDPAVGAVISAPHSWIHLQCTTTAGWSILYKV